MLTARSNTLAQKDDYIEHPKESGYHGIHLIYQYRSDKRTDNNSLKIEVQLRSQLQHAWATAVETVGTFVQQALKSMRIGMRSHAVRGRPWLTNAFKP